MIACAALIALFANFSMVSEDREAPFVLGWMGGCFFIPLGLLCFCIAGLVRGKRPDPTEDKTEQTEGTGEFSWSMRDDSEPKRIRDREW